MCVHKQTQGSTYILCERSMEHEPSPVFLYKHLSRKGMLYHASTHHNVLYTAITEQL